MTGELNAGTESARLKLNLPEVEHCKGTRPSGGAMGRVSRVEWREALGWLSQAR